MRKTATLTNNATPVAGHGPIGTTALNATAQSGGQAGSGGSVQGSLSGSTLAGDLATSSTTSSSSSVASHRLSGGLDFRVPGFGLLSSEQQQRGGGGGVTGGSSGTGGGLSGILSHSNNHLFSAMSLAGGGNGGEAHATPPLQRRLAKSFSVAQSSSLQKGHYIQINYSMDYSCFSYGHFCFICWFLLYFVGFRLNLLLLVVWFKGTTLVYTSLW